MKSFVKFMVNSPGRWLRIIAGLILIAIGAFMSPVINWTLIIIGLIPLSAGLFDFCLLAPLMGYFFSGKKTRATVNSQ
jgi:hypothetical protein